MGLSAYRVCFYREICITDSPTDKGGVVYQRFHKAVTTATQNLIVVGLGGIELWRDDSLPWATIGIAPRTTTIP